MDINIFAILLAAALSLVLAALWYGPLFGELWLKVIGATDADKAQRERMQREAVPLYVLTFFLTLVQVVVLAQLIVGLGLVQGVLIALLMWLAFVMPILATTAMWTNDAAEIKRSRFLLQAGYQLIVFALFGAVLALWG